MKNLNNTNDSITHKLKIQPHKSNIHTLQLLDEKGIPFANAVLPKIDKHTALKIHDTMQFIRCLDKRMLMAQRQGRISFYMQCIGEEAAVTASTASLADDDMILAQYREQASLYYRGFSIDDFMNQMFSNSKDLGKGRQMPVHYGSANLHYMTISSPLATQIPQASGYAYGQKLTGKKNCTLCYFGEGASSEGDFHAGLNMAAVHKCPVIFFCRNNGYAISTTADNQFNGDGIASRGIGYGIDTLRVDGTDVLAVYAATLFARKYVIEQQKPFLIEALCYRSAAHSSSDDPSGYRSKREEEEFLAKDPITRFNNWLIGQKWLDKQQDNEKLQEINQKILAALKKAEKIKKPDINEIINDVYDHPTENLQIQLDILKTHINKYANYYSSTVNEN